MHKRCAAKLKKNNTINFYSVIFTSCIVPVCRCPGLTKSGTSLSKRNKVASTANGERERERERESYESWNVVRLLQKSHVSHLLVLRLILPILVAVWFAYCIWDFYALSSSNLCLKFLFLCYSKQTSSSYWLNGNTAFQINHCSTLENVGYKLMYVG
jgi:hypothetical protein